MTGYRQSQTSSSGGNPVASMTKGQAIMSVPHRSATHLPETRPTGRGLGTHSLWRHTPQSAVTPQVLAAVLLIWLGVLLGAVWATQALQPKLRRQAEERRQLNEEWSAVRTARRQHSECPHCGASIRPGLVRGGGPTE
jgi:hypothetical protein